MNLVIVESPHKATQIQGFLGKDDFKVVSSKGHIRDLEEKSMSVDIVNGFTPKYVVSADKKSLVGELRRLSEGADMVWLASDPDREGEAIAWHLSQALGLDPAKTRRITYNEVTKKAVLDAINAPREIDMDLVNAQQARRVLDRLVGFEVSPILWRKIKKGLSAGRVQSATLRLVVDREREIGEFVPQAYYNTRGEFIIGAHKAKGLLDTKFGTLEEAQEFLQDSIGASYKVGSVDQKEGRKVPSAPFTTSTMQQEAARQLHFSSSRTMRVAQTLYEKGLITYMRTDSTNLSSLFLGAAKKYVCETFGEQYSHPRNYQTHSKGAQEAHEAIRPTFAGNITINGTADEQKLYSLIWKRALASQMSDAKVLLTSISVESDKRSEKFAIQSTRILFDGFLKLYIEGTDDALEDEENEEQILPAVNSGEPVLCSSIKSDCKFTQAPYRYSEQTLIKKMEEIGIGRPSTYAPTISTLTGVRGYVVTADKEGTPMRVVNLALSGGTVSRQEKTEMVGAEKKKLVPTEVGMMVTDYLVENFPDILDYDFTAKIEKDFDEIASGEKLWTGVISDFYTPFHVKVDAAIADKNYKKVERLVGVDPSDGKNIVAKFGPYGPYLQKGEPSERMFVNLPGDKLIETVTLEEALKLFALPRTVGQYEGFPIVAMKGRFGPYLKWNGKNVSIPKGTDPMIITEQQGIALIQADGNKTSTAPAALKEFGEISVMNGRYGAYIKAGGSNYRIPAEIDPASLTEQKCREIISSTKPTDRSKARGRRFTSSRKG